jgi:selenocysteine lyase/cysteine desulfurase
VIVSDLEHNSNYLPWYNITQQSNKKLLLLPYGDIIDLDTFSGILQDVGKPFLLSITHASNILG